MKYSRQLTLYLTEREQIMKHEKLRWALIILAGLFAVVCSVFLISAPSMMDSLGELNDTISASSKMLQQMLPEFDLNEQLYREVQYEMNTAVLRGFAYQLEREEELSAEEFEAKCERYDLPGGFILSPDGKVLCSAGTDTRARYEASLSGEEKAGTPIFYSRTLKDKRVLVLEFSNDASDLLIENSVSWKNRLQGIRIGQTGFACVLSKEGEIISHPETRLTQSEDTYFNLHKTLVLEDGLDFYYLESKSLTDSYNYCMIGRMISFQDYYIISGVTLPEFLRSISFEALTFPLLLFLVLYVVIRYLLLLRDASRKAARRRLFVAAVLGLVVLFFSSLYLQAVGRTAAQMAVVDNHAKNVVEGLQGDDSTTRCISEWYDYEQLRKCRVAADILYEGKNDLSRSEVREISAMLGSTWCFLFNSSGKVILTDSPYDHFSLSTKEGSQSSAFLPLLEGEEYVVQSPMPDDISGEERQYVGVSVRNESDLADGFVQITVDRTRYKEMNAAYGIRQEIEDISVNRSESAFAVDKESGFILYSTDPDLVGLFILREEYESLGSGYNGYLVFNNTRYIAGIRDSDPYVIFALIPKRTITPEILRTSLILSAVLLAALAAFALLMPQNMRKEETEDPVHFYPEGALGSILQRLLFVLCLMVTLQYFASVYSAQEFTHGGTSLIEFIMNGNWPREPNLFSVSYSLFIAAFVAASFGIVNRIIDQLARIGTPYVRTICYLIENVLKYACVLGVLYYCLAQFGVDTRTLLASAGIMSLVIGLGAKDLITDILAGLFIIFERTFEVGDFVTIEDFSGFVKEIGLRTTKVAFQSNVKIFNNADVRKVVNRKGNKHNVVVELGMSMDESLAHVEEVFDREFPPLKDKISGALSAPVCGGLAEITEKVWKMRVVLECDAGRQVPARAELLRELKLIAERNGICLAGKQIDVVEFGGTPDDRADPAAGEEPVMMDSVGSEEPGTSDEENGAEDEEKGAGDENVTEEEAPGDKMESGDEVTNDPY